MENNKTFPAGPLPRERGHPPAPLVGAGWVTFLQTLHFKSRICREVMVLGLRGGGGAKMASSSP